jgi:hypothetical protein
MVAAFKKRRSPLKKFSFLFFGWVMGLRKQHGDII